MQRLFTRQWQGEKKNLWTRSSLSDRLFPPSKFTSVLTAGSEDSTLKHIPRRILTRQKKESGGKFIPLPRAVKRRQGRKKKRVVWKIWRERKFLFLRRGVSRKVSRTILLIELALHFIRSSPGKEEKRSLARIKRNNGDSREGKSDSYLPFSSLEWK